MTSTNESTQQASRLLTLARRADPLADSAEQLRTLREIPVRGELAGDFDAHLATAGLQPLKATGIETLQLNLGRVCNQTCVHCHVDAGPDRTENMSHETAELCMQVLAATDIPTVDITGGAPEMCPEFKYLVTESRRLGRHVMDRCNLTILTTRPHADLADFLADNQVEVVCSLPHYRALSTDRQRGEGVYERSIQGLKMLNKRGYGKPGSGLRLVLVTNPVGAFLPSGQASLEDEWKRELKRNHDMEFNELISITNMAISRYLEWLQKTGNLVEYQQRLVDAFNPIAANSVMCRSTLNVGWQGELYDCDFNQMLDLEVGFGAPQHLKDFDLSKLTNRQIVTGPHCFGCTAGAGSSCGGSLA